MSFKDFVLDFFFPPRCAFCGAILEKSGDGVCETCRKALPRTADTCLLYTSDAADEP